MPGGRRVDQRRRDPMLSLLRELADGLCIQDEIWTARQIVSVKTILAESIPSKTRRVIMKVADSKLKSV